MDSTIFAIVLLVLGLALGVGAGWFFGSRPVKDLRDRLGAKDDEARELEEKFLRASAELGQSQIELSATKERAARVDALSDELQEAHKAKALLSERLAQIEASSDEREKAYLQRNADREVQFEREFKRLTEAEEKLQAKFADISEKMLSGAQTKLIEGAKEQLSSLNKESLAELEKKVGPVGESLERYRKRIDEIEKHNTSGFAQLKGVIGEVRDGQRQVIDGANQITTTLRGATKARGDWGELQLANLLESCGLYDKADFDFQVNVKDESDGNLRPDAVINIPGGRRLVVDVKNVFNTYVRANEADNEEGRNELLRAHARELRGHIDDLSNKRYQDFVPGSADFVVMFVPGEHVLYAALTQDGGILDYALKRKIALSSPLNFMSVALTVSTIWRQAGVEADAKEIAKLGKEIYDQLGVVAGHLSSLRNSLKSTNQHFDALVGSFDGRMRVRGEKFQSLSIDTSAKDISEALQLNAEPRRLVHFDDPDVESDPKKIAPE